MNKNLQNLISDSQSVSRKSSKTNKTLTPKKPLEIETKIF